MASFIGESLHLWAEWLRSEQEERSDKVPRGARMPEQRRAGQLVGHEGLRLTTSFTQAKSATRKLAKVENYGTGIPKSNHLHFSRLLIIPGTLGPASVQVCYNLLTRSRDWWSSKSLLLGWCSNSCFYTGSLGIPPFFYLSSAHVLALVLLFLFDFSYSLLMFKLILLEFSRSLPLVTFESFHSLLMFFLSLSFFYLRLSLIQNKFLLLLRKATSDFWLPDPNFTLLAVHSLHAVTVAHFQPYQTAY